jgi:hypothetical protein
MAQFGETRPCNQTYVTGTYYRDFHELSAPLACGPNSFRCPEPANCSYSGVDGGKAAGDAMQAAALQKSQGVLSAGHV